MVLLYGETGANSVGIYTKQRAEVAWYLALDTMEGSAAHC